jgi:pimeloyl-ACP methyl ester carboxylesterase
VCGGEGSDRLVVVAALVALLVSGAGSPAHLQAVTGRLATLLPDADRLTIAGATHNMFTSHPAQFNAGVLRFIQSHSAADR